jgi:hypothetical protein
VIPISFEALAAWPLDSNNAHLIILNSKSSFDFSKFASEGRFSIHTPWDKFLGHWNKPFSDLMTNSSAPAIITERLTPLLAASLFNHCIKMEPGFRGRGNCPFLSYGK